jgi:uncharacterized membrane protein
MQAGLGALVAPALMVFRAFLGRLPLATPAG